MGSVFLIPTYLSENAKESIPSYVLDAIRKCTVVFAESERTTRRFFKSLDREIIIDDYQWFTIGSAEEEVLQSFRKEMEEGKNIAVVSEAGCPGIADPGRELVAVAQKAGYPVKPLTGPSSIILALMASGMNGQRFEFVGYLPIDNRKKIAALKELENASRKDDSTKIFIETPYRNDGLTETILQCCEGDTRLCIAADLTGEKEFIATRTVKEWRSTKRSFHKIPAIFLLHAAP